MYKIEELFPAPLMIVDSICVDNLNQFEFIIKDIMKEKKTVSTEFQNVKSTHQTFSNLYDIVQFAPLVQEIQQHAYIFLETLGFSEQEIAQLRMNKMWANLVESGDYLFPHIHSHSIVSGAYYVKSSELDKIQFYNDIGDTSYVPAIESKYSKRWTDVDCKPGRLLLFKSNLPHGNTKKLDNQEKIVISFNISFNNG
jgi:uncharacterized protein (TIGR02466 family)